jgi:CheY-like chemotaxis protein
MNILVPWIEGDDILIKRVLMNIIGNAAKFTPAGGTITFSVDQKWEDNGLVATTFTCKDTGCGMDQEFMEHIWDTFTQEHRSENSKSSGGTGLGMAISKLLIDAMGGEISVDSKPGQGSTFTVTLHSSSASRILPRFSQQDDEKDSQTEAAPCKIIVAEDNELNAEILVEVLKGEGFEVAHAANGKEAVDIFSSSEENEYRLILMDMQMPVMDGCAATEKIRSLSRRDAVTIQIFACTANTFKEDRNRAYQSGMNDFLAKPIDVNELIQKIEGI